MALDLGTVSTETDSDLGVVLDVEVTNESVNRLQFEILREGDVTLLQELHEASFPIRYGEAFYNSIASGIYQNIPVYSMCAYCHQELCSEEEPSHGTKLVGNILAQLCTSMQGEGTNDLLSKESQRMGLTSCCYILTVAVDKEWQRHGIATMLLDEAIKHAEAEPTCGVVYLHVISYNDRAVSFYEKNGFLYKRKCMKFYYIDGKHYDALLYVKYLKGGKPPSKRGSIESREATSLETVFRNIFSPIVRSISSFFTYWFVDDDTDTARGIV